MPMTVTNEGDVVLVEQYTYMGALSCMRGMCAVPVGVKVDDDGINLEALEEACKTIKNVRYLYLIPNFQNPMGVTIPFEKRKKIYELACKYDFLIYEDDPYGELRYTGEPVPSFKSIDTEGRVVYAGSFSKILCSGIRLGFICASNEMIAKMTALKGNLDSGSPVSSSLIARYFMEEGKLDPHIEEVRALYAKKREAMLSGLDKYMSSKCTRTNPEGGMFLWVTLPEDADADAVFDACLENHIGVIPSVCFAPDESKPGKSFRLCFATPTLEEIGDRLQALRRCHQEVLWRIILFGKKRSCRPEAYLHSPATGVSRGRGLKGMPGRSNGSLTGAAQWVHCAAPFCLTVRAETVHGRPSCAWPCRRPCQP